MPPQRRGNPPAQGRTDKLNFLTYLGYLEKAGSALITQARRLQLLSNAALCAVAFGAAGSIGSVIYVHYYDLGKFDEAVICAFAPVLMGAFGLLLGRFIPVKAGMPRLDDENRISQKLAENWEQIERVSAELDALPNQKAFSARRAALTLQLNERTARAQELAGKLSRLEDESLGEVYMPRADFRMLGRRDARAPGLEIEDVAAAGATPGLAQPDARYQSDLIVADMVAEPVPAYWGPTARPAADPPAAAPPETEPPGEKPAPAQTRPPADKRPDGNNPP